MKKIYIIAIGLFFIFSTGCNLSTMPKNNNEYVPSKTSITSKGSTEKTSSFIDSSSSLSITSNQSNPNFSSSTTSSNKSSGSNATSKPSSSSTTSKTTSVNKEITNPDDPNFDPEHKEGYIYIPGEGYIKIEDDAGASGEEAMGGKDFWEVLEDPNNKVIGY